MKREKVRAYFDATLLGVLDDLLSLLTILVDIELHELRLPINSRVDNLVERAGRERGDLR